MQNKLNISVNIFDVSNIDDISDEVKAQLTKVKSSPSFISINQILELFTIKTTLSIDEFIVGIYRKYKVVKKRDWVANRLSVLSRNNKIKRIGAGIYSIK